MLTHTKHHSNPATRSPGSGLPSPRGCSSGSQGGSSQGGQERPISLLQPPLNPSSKRHPAAAAPGVRGSTRRRTSEPNSERGYQWLCCWRGATASVQVHSNSLSNCFICFEIFTPIQFSVDFEKCHLLLFFQVNLQHDGTHVRSEPHLWPACHYCPKVPRLTPASHLRDLRVSDFFQNC